MKANERLYLTADKSRLVGEGDSAAAFLYAAPGDQIPQSAADRFGLVDGRLPAKAGTQGSVPRAGSKERQPQSDKERKGGEDKGGQGGKPGEGPSDDLTEISGIGPATAKALAEAGVASFAQLAALDPKAPLALPGVKGRIDWQAWIAEAETLAAAAAAPSGQGGGLTINKLPRDSGDRD